MGAQVDRRDRQLIITHDHNPHIASTTSSPRSGDRRHLRVVPVALPPAQSITPNPSLSLVACIARLSRLRLHCISLYCTLRLVVHTRFRNRIHSPTAATRPRQHPQSHPAAMKSINRFLYGPTPEEKVRGWQQKLRQQERTLDREVLNVGLARLDSGSNITTRRIPFILSSPAQVISGRALNDEERHTRGETIR